ncbi:hypothetical protein PPGU19_091320 (plasmid) [Paraburkholderia sp. PGU19]|nr:hypothetical protein PPGU19_091320 [Paraburkholderia sp. PGU19]
MRTAAAADTRPQSWAMTKQALQLGKPLSSLTHEDCLRYHAFLADPQPAATWVAGGGRKHPRGDAPGPSFTAYSRP